MGGRWWTKKNKENMIGKRGTKLIVFLLFRGGPAIFFNIKIVLPPQWDQINRGRFFNPVSPLISISLNSLNSSLFHSLQLDFFAPELFSPSSIAGT